MMRTSELETKEVINIDTGQQLGMILDVDINLNNGQIKGLVVPKDHQKVFSFFGKAEETYIPWSDIYKIGEDVILVKLEAEEVTPELTE
ncbi:sporulation protein, YlmC/YmxH family [Halobacteroides halobius DSM 5150]|uniref:Sporulation protein, YlmC/YmxH family n=1 Tax=Halobacteroides halobius (strain ATCC 35273 / DSM 5150 / MD-1) TaxID=748449 RepID=L0KB63_HALHC|nr:YlmC/YmxH family sporulation protein [Halobacteroides halobius]AGB41624.1 sporulation protein, YlmC/YmxH family [Halobacteroides halobius DSM 5150]